MSVWSTGHKKTACTVDRVNKYYTVARSNVGKRWLPADKF